MGSAAAARSSIARKFNEIPGPHRIPILGSLYLYKLGLYNVDDYHDVLVHLFKKYGPLVREDIGPKNVIIHAFDPADARTVFYSEAAMPFVKPLQETTQLYRKKRNTSPGLGNTNGKEWYRLRSAVRKPMLRPKEVQSYLPYVNRITDDLIQRLAERKDHETHEVKNLRMEIGKWSREVSGWICFERRLGSFDGGSQEEVAERMLNINKKLFELSSKLKFSLPLYKVIPTSTWKELVRLEDIVHDHVVKLLVRSIKDVQQCGAKQESLLSYLLSRSELSEKDIEILILSIFGDGLSTTVPSLLYNLYCLATNPKIQEQVRGEVENATNGQRYISAEIINDKLKYLKAFVKETFRMYPIGTEISRVIHSDLILSNYHVPKGQFQPERWIGDSKNEIDPLLLVPFGHGTRTCAGRRFAEQDLYVSLAKILLHFKLEYPSDAQPMKQIYKILLFPKEPIRIRFKALQKKRD